MSRLTTLAFTAALSAIAVELFYTEYLWDFGIAVVNWIGRMK